MANHTGKGWFLPGHPHYPSKHPRRSKVQRAHVVQLFRENISDDELRAIIRKNLRDAMGTRIITLPDGTQRVEDDPNSDPRARVQARQQIYEYLMGRPPQPVEIDETDSADNVFDQLTNEQLEALIKWATATPSDSSDETKPDGAGSGEPPASSENKPEQTK